MCVFSWVSTNAGSTCKTNFWLAVTVGRVIVVSSNFGTLGTSGVTLITCFSKTFTPSAQTRMFQSAGKPRPHAPQDAHHLIFMSPTSVVGADSRQIQLGS